MKMFNDLTEAKKIKKVVFSFGRMNPPTLGHEKLINKVSSEAKKRKAEAHLYISHTQDRKKNPLTYAQKLRHIKMGIPNAKQIVKNSSLRTPFEVLDDLSKKGYTDVTMVVGSDRVANFRNSVKPYLDEYGFKFTVVSAGARDPDSEGIEGLSASKLRELASQNNFQKFATGTPSRLSSKFQKQMFDEIRKGLQIKEDYLPLQKSYGVPRHQMPQIPRKFYMKFFQDIDWTTGAKVQQKLMVAKSLKPTQKELNTYRIKDQHKYISQSGKISPIIVSNNGYLLDGHHRWAAIMEYNQDMKIPCFVVDLNISELLQFASSWALAEYEEF